LTIDLGTHKFLKISIVCTRGRLGKDQSLSINSLCTEETLCTTSIKVDDFSLTSEPIKIVFTQSIFSLENTSNEGISLGCEIETKRLPGGSSEICEMSGSQILVGKHAVLSSTSQVVKVL
jgi:hypothetical protein